MYYNLYIIQILFFKYGNQKWKFNSFNLWKIFTNLIGETSFDYETNSKSDVLLVTKSRFMFLILINLWEPFSWEPFPFWIQNIPNIGSKALFWKPRTTLLRKRLGETDDGYTGFVDLSTSVDLSFIPQVFAAVVSEEFIWYWMREWRLNVYKEESSLWTGKRAKRAIMVPWPWSILRQVSVRKQTDGS